MFVFFWKYHVDRNVLHPGLRWKSLLHVDINPAHRDDVAFQPEWAWWLRLSLLRRYALKNESGWAHAIVMLNRTRSGIKTKGPTGNCFSRRASHSSLFSLSCGLCRITARGLAFALLWRHDSLATAPFPASHWQNGFKNSCWCSIQT